MTSTKRGCQHALELEAKIEREEREEGSSPKSSISMKELIHYLIKAPGEFLRPQGPSCVIMGGTLE
jgi:hypothetical protein